MKQHKYAARVGFQGVNPPHLAHSELEMRVFISERKARFDFFFFSFLLSSFLYFSETETTAERETGANITREAAGARQTAPRRQPDQAARRPRAAPRRSPHLRGHSLEFAVQGGNPFPPLGLEPRATKSWGQRGPLNSFFKKEKKKKFFLPSGKHHFVLLKDAATAFKRMSLFPLI